MAAGKGLFEFLQEHRMEHPVSFHMPGHKGTRFFRRYAPETLAFFEAAPDFDITEIPGADNLFQPESVIRSVMERYRRLYDVKCCRLLINGSSAGLIAAVLTAVPAGGKLIMGRNCHKSVYNALRLGGITPIYLWPKGIDGSGICGEITPEDVRTALVQSPDASAVLITSPNYYGICSDIKAIADEVHIRDKILIVDQAHGAHLRLMEKASIGRSDRRDGMKVLSGEGSGADIVINSVHKTLASFTQTAVANICSDKIDTAAFDDRLQMLESSSPSYLLMASLDINAAILEERGSELLRQWTDRVDRFYDESRLTKGLRVIRHPLLDKTKINLDMGQLSLSGAELERALMEKGIYTELTTGNIVMAMTGIGNDDDDFERLLRTLAAISHRMSEEVSLDDLHDEEKCEGCGFPYGKRDIRQAPLNTDRWEPVHWSLAAGRVSAGLIIPYPPGIPLLCPGEIMDEETLAYAYSLRKRGEKVIGMTPEGLVRAGRL